MTIAKMSMNRNSSRYFKISVNGFENGCMSGIIYHAGTAPGIRFENYPDIRRVGESEENDGLPEIWRNEAS